MKQISFRVKNLGGNLPKMQSTIVKRSFRFSTKLLSLDSTILVDELTAETRAVNGSVQVGFVPNPELTRQNRVNGLTTHRWLSTTSGQVDSVFDRQQSSRSASVWVWIIRSSPDQAQNHHIKPRFERKSPDLSKNQRKTTTSSSDLSEGHRI